MRKTDLSKAIREGENKAQERKKNGVKRRLIDSRIGS